MADSLLFERALSRPDLLAPSVASIINQWKDASWIDEVCVAEIDPAFAGGVKLCQRYGLDEQKAGNAVLIEAKRSGNIRNAACLVRPGVRTDLNGAVRRHLQARQVSLMSKECAVRDSSMEYGSITVVGLPGSWPILIDPALATIDYIVVGSGLLRSKLRLPMEALLAMTSGFTLEGMTSPSESSR